MFFLDYPRTVPVHTVPLYFSSLKGKKNARYIAKYGTVGRKKMTEDKNRNEILPLELNENGEESNLVPLDDRVMEAVKASENYTIQPVTLASALGISIDDATMELCGLLRAVGTTASYRIDDLHRETFVFPADFEKRARAHRRGRQTKATLQAILRMLWKVIQIVVAFGLLLSLLTVGLVVITALILSSRQQHSRDRIHHFIRRSLVTLQQLLWIYSINNHYVGVNNPLLSDNIQAIWLGIGICCTRNPLNSIYLCFRAHRLARRRRFATRGWGTTVTTTTPAGRNHENRCHSLPLTTRWLAENTQSSFEEPQSQRGLLYILVEFLFGPLSQTEGKNDLWKWKLREYIIVSNGFRLTLAQLQPFIDNPGLSSHIPQTLDIIYHFHGKPDITTNHQENENGDAMYTQYTFSELQSTYTQTNHIDDSDLSKWQHHWFPSNNFFSLYDTETTPISNINNNNNILPTYLRENYHALTKLSLDEFKLCSILGVINLIGVHWLKYTLIPQNKALPLRWLLKPFSSLLMHYSYLFMALPILRLLFLTLLNIQIQRRNQLRYNYANNT